MAFILKKTDLTELHKETTKEFAYNDDLKISFKSLANPKFQRAYGIINQKSATDTPLNAQTIGDIDDDELTPDEALLFAVGSHLVADWNVENENGEKLPINGENFTLLSASVDDPMAFFHWCLECSGQIAKQIAEQAQHTKKKPSKGGSGKSDTAI